MEEPVILPTSGITMDKKNIVRHLLRYLIQQMFVYFFSLLLYFFCSISEDPFNRQYLIPSMLEPNDDMFKKIKEWKKGRGIE